MRILKITEDSIEFDNGKDISFDHYQECCEINYAVGYNNLGMDLNYEIYDSLSSAKERFNELVSGGRYDMVLLCKKALGNKSPRYDGVIYRWDSSDE